MIPQIEPWIDERELQQLNEVIEAKWLVEGSKTEQFEHRFARMVGCRHAVAVNNATVALYLVLKALGLGDGDEVILPDFTFIATVNAVVWTGAKPVLVDIQEQTLCLDPEQVQEHLTPRTRAIIPVHLYGQSADMEALRSIVDGRDISIIEDASESIGCRFQERHVGVWGRAGCFSFYGNKTITTGQGGMITTDDEEIARMCFILKNQGRETRGTFIHHHFGYNFSFTDLQAAIGLAQMGKLNEILRRKLKVHRRYRDALDDVGAICFPRGDPRCQTVPWFTNILVDDPEALGEHLAKGDIGTRRLFYPLHLQPCYRGWFEDRYPVSVRMYQKGLSLPSAATLKENEIEMVCERIRSFYCGG